MIMALMSDLRCGDIVPLPSDLLRVWAAWFREHAPQRGGGQLLAHLPHSALGVVGEQHETLVPVQVERRQQPPGHAGPLLPGEGPREVSHLGRHRVIDID